MKAWYLASRSEPYLGYVVHAETRGKAKSIGIRHSDYFGLDTHEWIYLEATRYAALDNKPITVQNLIDAGMDMTFEGEPITEIDLPCPCELCRQK